MKVTLSLIIVLMSFSAISLPNKKIKSNDGYIPKIKIGAVFGTEKSEYKLSGISGSSSTFNSTDKTNEYLYEYLNQITEKAYGHKVTMYVLGVKNDIVVRYVLILLPNVGDTGVPSSMLERFKSETGFQLGKVGDKYGATIDNLFVLISRVNSESFGGDRLKISVSLKE